MAAVRPQFLLPMALYRMAGSAGWPGQPKGWRGRWRSPALLGSPVIARADRRASTGGAPQRQRAAPGARLAGLGSRAKNPYTWLLYTHLAALGVRVRDFTPARALLGGYDILHLHWPEKALNAGPSRAARRRCRGARHARCRARLHRARVVWTAHNAQAPRVEASRTGGALLAGRGSRGGCRDPSQPRRAALGRGQLPAAGGPAPRRRAAGTLPRRLSRHELSRDEAPARRSACRPRRTCRRLRGPGAALQGRPRPRSARSASCPRARGVVLLVGGAAARAGGGRGGSRGRGRRSAGPPDAPSTCADDETSALPGPADLVALPFRDITNSGERAAGAHRSIVRCWCRPAARWASSRRSSAPIGSAPTRAS